MGSISIENVIEDTQKKIKRTLSSLNLGYLSKSDEGEINRSVCTLVIMRPLFSAELSKQISNH